MTTEPKAGSRTKKPTGPEQVADFLNSLEHPLKKEIEEVRNIILAAHPGLTEHIKWNAPSFRFEDEDRVTFHLHGKGYFTLVFHCGAKVKKENQGQGRLIDDVTGLLNWAADDRATATFTDMADVEAKREKLTEVVTKWLEAGRS